MPCVEQEPVLVLEVHEKLVTELVVCSSTQVNRFAEERQRDIHSKVILQLLATIEELGKEIFSLQGQLPKYQALSDKTAEQEAAEKAGRAALESRGKAEAAQNKLDTLIESFDEWN